MTEPATVAGDEEHTMGEMSIGEFGRATGLSVKALRLYDELDLVPPTRVDAHSGYRRYTEAQLETARLVATLRLVGMPLARIRAVLAQPSHTAAAEIASYWRQVEADVASRREIVCDLVHRLEEETEPMPTTRDSFRPTVASSHHRGARRRQQDAFRTTTSVLAVADGTGDQPEDLADLALDTLLSHGFAAAVDVIAERDGDGATTLTAISFHGGSAEIQHVGDGRVHLVRDGQARCLTRDHTLVAGLIEAGELTADEARSHPDRLLLNRALAPANRPEPDLIRVPLAADDRWVLTTDGVHSVLEPDHLARLLTTSGDPDAVVAAIAAAVERAGAPDNHTVVVADLVAIG